MRKKQIIMSWEKGTIKPKELIGHDDHVVTCLQFDGAKIVSGSDDNTLKVNHILTYFVSPNAIHTHLCVSHPKVQHSSLGQEL